MTTKLVDSEDIGASFSTSMSGLLASVSMARIAIESRDRIITDLQVTYLPCIATSSKPNENFAVYFIQTKLAGQEKTITDLQVIFC